MAGDKERPSSTASQLQQFAANSSDSPDRLLVKPYIPPVPAFIKQLYSLPALVGLQEHLSTDAMLYQTVINTLNHPLFGLNKAVINIDDALDQIDAQTICDIANVYSYKFEIDNGSAEVRQLWVIAEQMARFAAILSHELSLYTPAKVAPIVMMHHCGLIAMLTKYPNYLSMVKMGYRTKTHAVTYYEDVAINTNHAVVGELISQSRSLPSHFTEVIGYQHDIDYINQAKGEHMSLLFLLKATQDIVGIHQLIGKAKKNHEWTVIQDTVLTHLGLSKAQYKSLKQRLTS